MFIRAPHLMSQPLPPMEGCAWNSGCYRKSDRGPPPPCPTRKQSTKIREIITLGYSTITSFRGTGMVEARFDF